MPQPLNAFQNRITVLLSSISVHKQIDLFTFHNYFVFMAAQLLDLASPQQHPHHLEMFLLYPVLCNNNSSSHGEAKAQ